MKLKLYHGSTNIVKQPKYGFGTEQNDFGKGFYCTEDEKSAKRWSAQAEDVDGYVNAYSLNTDNLNVLNLNDTEYSILNQLAILVNFRKFDLMTESAKQVKDYLIANYYIEPKKYDIVIGDRVDSAYSSIASDFLHGKISLKQLATAFKLGELGEQTTIVSNRAFGSIRYLGSKKVTSSKLYNERMEQDIANKQAYLNKTSEFRNEYDINDVFAHDLISFGHLDKDDVDLIIKSQVTKRGEITDQNEMIALIKERGSNIFCNFGQNFYNNQTVILEAIKQDIKCLNKVPQEVYTQEFAKELCSCDYLAYNYLPKELKTNLDVIKAGYKKFPSILNIVSAKNILPVDFFENTMQLKQNCVTYPNTLKIIDQNILQDVDTMVEIFNKSNNAVCLVCNKIYKENIKFEEYIVKYPKILNNLKKKSSLNVNIFKDKEEFANCYFQNPKLLQWLEKDLFADPKFVEFLVELDEQSKNNIPERCKKDINIMNLFNNCIKVNVEEKQTSNEEVANSILTNTNNLFANNILNQTYFEENSKYC